MFSAAVNQKLVFFGVEADNSESLINYLAKHLQALGYVDAEYKTAVVEREKLYPTGLNLDGVSVAMPHTTGQHILRPTIAVAQLAKPVKFYHMGEPETEVLATFAFMMAIKDHDDQIEWLKNLMHIFEDANSLAALRSVRNRIELISFVLENLQPEPDLVKEVS
jgi:PTS system galactitol-specific IIA component